jgi:hypothetical protein
MTQALALPARFDPAAPERSFAAPGLIDDPWLETRQPKAAYPYFVNLTHMLVSEIDRHFANYASGHCDLALTARYGDTDFIFCSSSSTGQRKYKVEIFRDFDQAVYGGCSCPANDRRLMCKHIAAGYLEAVATLQKEGKATRDIVLFLSTWYPCFAPELVAVK